MAQTLSELLVAIGIDTKALTDGASGAADEVESTLGGIQTAAAGAAVGGLFMAGLTNAMDAQAANTQLTNQLGLTAGEAAKAGDSAGRVFSAGFGESIDEVNESLGAVAQNMGGMGKVSSDSLDQMTKNALALSDTFKFDVADSAQAVGSLVKSGLAKDGIEGFDLLTAAAQKLPPAMLEELPDLTNEYSEFFDQLGFTGPQMMGLLAQGAKDPLFELDKLGDAVKEFTLRLADTSAVKGPLESLGLNVKDIQKLVNTGHGTKAFDDVTTALKGVDDQTKRTKIQAALFGGPGEDMGNTLLKLDAGGAAAASGMDKAAGSAKKITDSVGASKSIDSIWRTLSTTIGDQLAPALKIFSDFMKDNPGLIQALSPAILLLAGALGIAAIAQWAMNSAMLANPVTWIIVVIVGLIAIIVLIATKTTWFQTIWEALKTAFSATVDGIMAALNWLGAIPGKVSGWFGQAKDWAVEKLLALVAWVITLPGRITKALSSLATNLSVTAVTAFMRFQTAAKDKANGLLDYVKSIPGRIKSALGSLGGLLLGAGKSIVQGLINGVTNMIGSLKSRFSSITNMIPDWKGPMTVDLKLLGPSGEALMSGLMDGIDDQTPALHKKLNSITADIPANVQTSVSNSGQSGASQSSGRLLVDIEGSDSDSFKAWIRSLIQADSGGDAQRFFGSAA